MIKQLNFEYDISKLKPADYNPRAIEGAELEALKASLSRFGVVKPIIARGETIVAGHQRTRALLGMGVKFAPVFTIFEKTTMTDECLFNQLHNANDIDDGAGMVFVRQKFEKTGFHVVESSKIRGNPKAGGEVSRAAITRLIAKYGPWGSSIVTKGGKVVSGWQYALSCIAAHEPLTVFVVDDADVEPLREALGAKYGEFNYDQLERFTYIQTLVQPNRLNKDNEDGTPKQNQSSRLYTWHVIPVIKKEQRGIDFGSGKGQHAKALRANGYNLLDLEMFRRKEDSRSVIDMPGVNRMIDEMLESVSKFGPFDYVVCDSVINSVDCPAAERAVMVFLNALCKPGGSLFFSGKSLKFFKAYKNMRLTNHSDPLTYSTLLSQAMLLDKNNFCAIPWFGEWYYQHFHDEAGARSLLGLTGFEVTKFTDMASMWQLTATKKSGFDWPEVRAAIEYEFTLSYNKDRLKIGRVDDVVAVFQNYIPEFSH